MPIHKTSKPKQRPFSSTTRSPTLLLITSLLGVIALLYLLTSFSSTKNVLSSFSTSQQHTAKSHNKNNHRHHEFNGHEKYLYWGDRIDCPGKHCESCEGLGHQESSLRCALEEAMFLQRTFVMPSRMCINPIHNKKGILHHSSNETLDERWGANSCSMDSLYDLDLISETVPVILDNSRTWHHVLSTSMKLGSRGIAHVQGASRIDLKEKSLYSNILLINRTASPLSWFMECKDRNNRSAIMLPYSFLPKMASKRLRDAADECSRLSCFLVITTLFTSEEVIK